MGESSATPLKPQFGRRVRLEFRGAAITSDAGLPACRELDDALGLTETATACLQESRGGRSVQMNLIKIGAQLVRHARRLVFQFAEVAMPRNVFRSA